MKAAVKALVDSIEQEIIDNILVNAEKSEFGVEKDLELGKFTYDIMLNDSWTKWEEARNNYLTLEVKSVSVTNENNKVLTNLSKEVFNQLEDNYTNY
jgi:hypothetical protein